MGFFAWMMIIGEREGFGKRGNQLSASDGVVWENLFVVLELF